MLNTLLLIGGLALILLGANGLTDGAAAVAKKFRISDLVIGLTIVAFGTSAPELVISVMAALGGSADMAIGNVVGSNAFNTLMILGVCALFSPLTFTKSNIRRDIPICILATLALLVVTLFNQDINRLEGAILLLGYIVMIVFMIRAEKRAMLAEVQPVDQDVKPVKLMPMWRVPIWILAGLAGLIYGGELFVNSASDIARSWGVSEAVIAITLVAGGTSMPELASSLVSVAKGQKGMALGNVLGSNLFNILFILGGCSMITPLTLGDIDIIDISMVVLSAVIPFIFAFTFKGRQLDRKEGVAMVAIYIGYVAWLISKI